MALIKMLQPAGHHQAGSVSVTQADLRAHQDQTGTTNAAALRKGNVPNLPPNGQNTHRST
jgi:hypothetical protein